ncbi:glycosyltransferase family 2 protein [Hyphococcus sp.]|uniref:glycosyltransferase family 2 protein n=1 Tax=Hyphococcus sp. TaxID=2038636 RepID=UPI0035C78337
MQKAQTPKVVALLPAWNAGDFITATLESLAAQSWPNFEVLVSVDQSTDETAALCRLFATGDDRFQVIEQKERLGWIGNVNALLDAAEGDYYLIAYHDDVLDPAHVQTLAALLESRPEAVVAYGDIRAHYLTGDVIERAYDEIDGVRDPATRAGSIIRRKGYWSTPNHGLFRASAVEATGGFRRHSGGEFSADWPWLLKMALLGEFVRAPYFLCDKYYKSASLSHNWSWDFREFAGVFEECARVIRASALPVPVKARLSALLAAEFLKEQGRKGFASLKR